MFIFCKGAISRMTVGQFSLRFFFRNVEKKDRKHRFTCRTQFLLRLFFYLFTGRSLLFPNACCIALLSRCWKCTIYCQAAKNDFRFTLRWYNYNTAIALNFFFRFNASIFSSIFAYQNHSSSFSAKKKRKKSVITFNFNSIRSLSAQTTKISLGPNSRLENSLAFTFFVGESLFYRWTLEPTC